MTRQGTGLGLSPDQARHLERIEDLARTARSSGHGRVVFLAGAAGSGRSFALRRVAPGLGDSAPWARVVTAVPIGDDPRGTAREDPRIPLLESVVTKTLTVGAALVSPLTAVLAGLLDLSLSSSRLIESMHSREEQFEPAELMEELLRRAAGERASSPLICLADDADRLGGEWWTSLQFLFAAEIAEEHPLVLVLAVDGPVDLGEEPVEGESTACSVARSLKRRGLADWLPLGELSPDDAMSWLGPAKQALITAALEISDGRAGDLAATWGSWRERNVIERDEGGRWSPTGRLEGIRADAAKSLSRRLSERVGVDDPDRIEAARLLLACGSLEGRIFTAEAVADVFGWDREGVIDLLDLLVDDEHPDRGVLEELEAIEIRDLTFETSRSLCRYRFSRGGDWHAIRNRPSDESERAQLAPRLVEALVAAYEPEVHAIAHTVAAICRAGGDAAAAEHYQRAAHGASRAAHKAMADHLLCVDAEAWSIWDFRDAGKRLLAACGVLTGKEPPSTLLRYSEKAGEFARRANPIGKGMEAEALCREALFYRLADEYETAKQRAEIARKLARYGAPAILALSLKELCLIELDLGADPAVAVKLIEEAARLFRREGLVLSETSCLYSMARIASWDEDLSRARELGEDVRKRAERFEDAPLRGSALHLLGDIEDSDDNFELARKYALEALALKRGEGDLYDIADCLRLLGSIEVSFERYEEAWKNATKAMAIQREQEDRNGEAASQAVRALAALGMRERNRARECFEEACRLYAEIGKHGQAAELRKAMEDL